MIALVVSSGEPRTQMGRTDSVENEATTQDRRVQFCVCCMRRLSVSLSAFPGVDGVCFFLSYIVPYLSREKSILNLGTQRIRSRPGKRERVPIWTMVKKVQIITSKEYGMGSRTTA